MKNCLIRQFITIVAKVKTMWLKPALDPLPPPFFFKNWCYTCYLCIDNIKKGVDQGADINQILKSRSLPFRNYSTCTDSLSIKYLSVICYFLNLIINNDNNTLYFVIYMHLSIHKFHPCDISASPVHKKSLPTDPLRSLRVVSDLISCSHFWDIS